jgi:hypothetical protein
VAALPAIAPIPALKSSERGALLRDMLEVAEADYTFVLRALALQEIAGQAKLGGKPTGSVVDGRSGKPITEATRSIVVWFADRAMLAAAITAARDALARNGRRLTGRTIGTLSFYSSVGKGGAITQGDPSTVAARAANPAALDLYVTAPLPHVRRWQWFGKTGERLQRASRNKALVRYARAMKRKPMQVSASVFEIAARQVQAKFRALDVLFVYLRWPNLNPGGGTAVDRIPAIKVRMKVRGRGR